MFKIKVQEIECYKLTWFWQFSSNTNTAANFTLTGLDPMQISLPFILIHTYLFIARKEIIRKTVPSESLTFNSYSLNCWADHKLSAKYSVKNCWTVLMKSQWYATKCDPFTALNLIISFINKEIYCTATKLWLRAPICDNVI